MTTPVRAASYRCQTFINNKFIKKFIHRNAFYDPAIFTLNLALRNRNIPFALLNVLMCSMSPKKHSLAIHRVIILNTNHWSSCSST
ncbi:hypothetical protein [Halodesulfovibrio sp.]|uniref:hypothetical protein n=1 Tax=Halodesulfovibrio sp. TaxID=1912772 RepID=UPI0025FE99D8|nr:hypothetical protein [Halodesulfovibrio sp.]MCT4533750.1 hypothetical protein [Halodesulfovibrio sp.]